MLSGALKNQPKQKSGRAIALPAPPPPRSLNLYSFTFGERNYIFYICIINSVLKTVLEGKNGHLDLPYLCWENGGNPAMDQHPIQGEKKCS